jgi:hypothetical protein
MCNSFLDFWNGERVDAIGSNRGKLDTYFYIKTHFGKEKGRHVASLGHIILRYP